MDRSEKTRLNRELMKETPKGQINELLDNIGSIGVEREIGYRRLVRKEPPNKICIDLHISTSTYYRTYRNLLIKISKVHR